MERRQPVRPDGAEAIFERVPHHVLYPLIGFFLGLGSPVGAFLMRFWLADPILKALWVSSELRYNALFYIYMGVGTITAFVVFGYTLGVRSESQRVHNKDLRGRLQELHLKSVTDGLTGIYSHAYLQETLAIEMDRSRRTGRPLSVLIMDFDDFKKINDTHGHLFGDRVLKEVTETINMNIRQEDVLGRYGGDEFLVIMPGTDASTAARVADRIRGAVARAGIIDRRDGERPVKTTLSIGSATFPSEGAEDAPSLVDKADKNLYQAKHKGKNQVCA